MGRLNGWRYGQRGGGYCETITTHIACCHLLLSSVFNPSWVDPSVQQVRGCGPWPAHVGRGTGLGFWMKQPVRKGHCLGFALAGHGLWHRPHAADQGMLTGKHDIDHKVPFKPQPVTHSHFCRQGPSRLQNAHALSQQEPPKKLGYSLGKPRGQTKRNLLPQSPD